MDWIDMTDGGWTDWWFGPWGRAKDWRLHAPEGTSYTMGEIDYLRHHVRDYDYLSDRVRALEQQIEQQPLRISEEERQVLYQASLILEKKLKEFCENQLRKKRYAEIIAYNDHLAGYLNALRAYRARRR